MTDNPEKEWLKVRKDLEALYPEPSELRAVLIGLVRQHVATRYLEQAPQDGEDHERVRVNTYITRELYDKLYDDAERYKVPLASITNWRLGMALGVFAPGSVPQYAGMSRRPWTRATGRFGRTIMMAYDGTVASALTVRWRALRETGRHYDTQVELATALLEAAYKGEGE